MRKTVHSELDTAGSQPYRLTIVPLDLDEDPLILPYNPEATDTEISPMWSARGLAGAWRDKSDWVGNTPRQLSYTQMLTAKDFARVLPGGEVVKDQARLLEVERVCSQLENWAEFPTDKTQRPTLVDVIMGARIFRGHIDHLRINRLRTTVEGYALTAEITITFALNPE